MWQGLLLCTPQQGLLQDLPQESGFTTFLTSSIVGRVLIEALVDIYLGQAGNCQVFDVSGAVKNVVEVLNPSLQNLLLLCQQLRPINVEEGRGAGGLWSVYWIKSMVEVLHVVDVCVALDFIGLLAKPTVLYLAKISLHLTSSVVKGIFLG